MTEQSAPEYEIIRAAVAGEPWAIEKVVAHYQDEIDKEATVRKRQPDGSWNRQSMKRHKKRRGAESR